MKINKRITILLFITLVSLVIDSPNAAESVTINLKNTLRTFDGWGVSLCWWAVRIGNWPEENLDNIVALITDPDTGLGYNIFRYNIGGGDNPSHSHMRTGGNVPGYKVSENGDYDWSADPNQRAVLNCLLKHCPDAIVEAFSNSPPWWMTKSGCSSGNTDGSNNLKDDYYDDFAEYLVDVAKHFHDELGITFSSLEPLNESEEGWWKANGSQEGCHFDRSSQEKIIQELYKALSAVSLEKNIKISADDANSIDACYANVTNWSSQTISCLGRINTHSYSGTKRKELRSRADELKLPLYQSESGPLSWSGNSNYDATLMMSRRILSDLNDMGAQAWIDWQLLDDSDIWKLIATDWTGTFSQEINFFARSAFSRFIRPGWSIVGTSNSNIITAAAPSGNDFGIVILNETSTEKQYTITISEIDTSIHALELYRTSITDQCLLIKPVTISNNTATIPVPGSSIISLRPQTPERVSLTGVPLVKGEPWSGDTTLAHTTLKALDGNADTYADCWGDSVWAGYDFGNNNAAISQIHFLPRKGFGSRSVGKTIEISEDKINWTTIHTFEDTPADGRYTIINFNPPVTCSAIRFNGMGDNINIAEILFYGSIDSGTDVFNSTLKANAQPAFLTNRNSQSKTVTVTNPFNKPCKVTLYRINGTAIASQILPPMGSGNIDCSSFTSGTYLFSFSSETGSKERLTQKIVM